MLRGGGARVRGRPISPSFIHRLSRHPPAAPPGPHSSPPSLPFSPPPPSPPPPRLPHRSRRLPAWKWRPATLTRAHQHPTVLRKEFGAAGGWGGVGGGGSGGCLRVTVRRGGGGGGRRKAGKKGVEGDGAPEMEPAQTGDDAGAGAASFRGWKRAQPPPATSLPVRRRGAATGRAVHPPPFTPPFTPNGALWGRGPPTFPANPRGRAGARKPRARGRDEPPSVCPAMPGKKRAGRGVRDASAAGQWAGPVTVTSGGPRRGRLPRGERGPTAGRGPGTARVGGMIGIYNCGGNSQPFQRVSAG